MEVWRSYNKNNFACFFWDTVYKNENGDYLWTENDTEIKITASKTNENKK